MMSATSDPTPVKAKTLVVQLRDTLRAAIERGDYAPGDRLPSEAQLTRAHNVSRTVVREAIAALRADGLAEPRQGAGVFVTAPPALPFQNLDVARVSSMIEMLELRTALESDAAALAALRRSAQQDEAISLAYTRFQSLAAQGEPTAEADLAFHLAVAEATNNPRFVEFLHMIGLALIPRRSVKSIEPPLPADYLRLIDAEHRAIATAISDGDADAARAAMRHHLTGSQTRYRAMLRHANPAGPA